MKASKDTTASRIKWTEAEIKSKSTWTSFIDHESWEAIVEKINLSGEYPKGTQTAPRHITYSAYINKVVETIRINAKPRYRTDTELFRIALHIGISVLYKIFCTKPSDIIDKSRGHFFYNALDDLNKKMERATIVSIVKEKAAELSVLVKKNSMTQREANKAMDIFIAALDKDDEKYIRSFISTPREDNVKDINEDFLRKLMSCE